MFGEHGDTQAIESGGEGRPPRRSRARAWIRGLAIAALVLVVLVAAAVFWVIESARKGQLSERLLKLSNQVLSNSSNLRVYADHIRVSGGTVELQSLHVDAREKGKWYRVLDARSGRFSSDLEALIFKRPQVFDLSLSGPVLHIVTADDSAIVLPSFASRGKGGGGGLQDGLVLTLDNLTVRSHARGDSTQWWEDGALVARVRPEGRGYVIGLDHAKGRCAPVGLVLRSASGKATAVADTIRFQSLVAETDAGRARLAGALENHRLAGTFQADDWPWEFFGDLLEQPTLDVPGGVSVRGEVGGTVEKLEFRTAVDGRWRDEPFQGAIDGRAIPHGLSISRAELAWRDARFNGTAAFQEAGQWKIGGQVNNVDLAQVEKLFPGVKLPPSHLSGPARMVGSQGALEIASTGINGSVKGVSLAGIRGSWRIRGHQHQVSAKGSVAGGDLAFAGGWDARNIALEGTASHEDLSTLGKWIPALAKGSGRLEETRWSISGATAAPRIRLNGSLTAAELPPASAGEIGFHYDGTWGKTPAGVAAVRASDVAVEGWRADTLWTEARHVGAHVVFSPLEAVRGDTTLTARLEIQPRDHGYRVLADTLRLDSDRGWVAADGPLDLESDRGTWIIRHAALSGSAGHLELAGRFRNENDLDLQLQGRGLAAAELASVMNLHGWGGDLSLDAHMTADQARRRLDASLTASHLVSPVLQADSVSAALELEESGGALHVNRLHAVLGHSVLDGSGQAELAQGQWPLDPGQWSKAAGKARGWRGEVTLKDFDIARLSSVWPSLEGLEGRATGSLRLGGSPTDPQGGSDGTLANLFYHGHPIEPIQWRVRYADKAVQVEDLRIGLGDSAAVVHGTIPLDLALGTPHDQRFGHRPVDLSLEASKVSLGEIATFLPFIAYSDGVLAAHVHIGGLPGHWRPTGALDITKGRVRFTGREEFYRDVQAHLVLDSTIVRVQNLKAAQGKDGVLSGSGTITLGKGIESYDLKLQATNALALASGEYEAHFDGTFEVGTGPRLAGSWFPLPSVKGKLTVRDGTVLYDFADPTNRVYFSGPKQAPVFVYDVDVYGERSIFWKTPAANIEMKVDLNVVQTVDSWLALGSVEAVKGTYQFLSNKFTVDSGTLVFDSVEPLNPTVTASAHADITGTNPPRRVTVILSDRIQTPQITMTDDQGDSEGDIATMLALGYNPKEGGTDVGTNAGVAAKAFGGQYLLRQFQAQFPEITPIIGDLSTGTQIVETGEGGRKEVVPTLGIRKDITGALSLNYSQIVGAPTTSTINLQVRDFGAEYRINRIFYLTGEILERRPGTSGSTSSTQSQFEYNLDLRARHEY